MSKKTLAELVSAMQGNSMTYGWDAVTLYDQRKANELLFQLYIERFNSEDGYIKPATMIADWGNGNYVEHLYNLKLSAPRLSFESSDPSLPARARLTMDMVGGMIVSTEKHSGGSRYVSRMLQVLPVGGPQLWMEQPVTKGVITGREDVDPGTVVIDIAEADTFMANFVVGDLSQKDVGLRFEQYFKEEVTPEQKKFPLGRLQGDLNGVLTPKNFEIRTMKSDQTAVFGDESYGDGAVMMFITLKDGEDGDSFPNANSQYLLPADEGGTKYTGAMLLSSRVLFDKIMRGPATDDIGNGITFLDYTPENGGGKDVGWTLKGASGGVAKDFGYDFEWRPGAWGNFKMSVNSRFAVDGGGPALTVRGGGAHIEFLWDKNNTCPAVRLIPHDIPFEDDVRHNNIMIRCIYSVKFDVALDKTSGLVSFVHNPSTSHFSLTSTGWEPFDDIYERLRYELDNLVNVHYKPIAENLLKELSTPTLDTFLARNLLFPGQNALHLSDAFVPGDLAVFGQIDPVRTTTRLTPVNSTLEAGQKLQFTLTPMPEEVEWSVKDVDGQFAQPGVISSKGEYIAPSAAELPDGFVAVMVTAKGMLNGHAVQSSALVSVLPSAIVANPMFDSCDTGASTLLTAEAVGGEVLEWEILTQQQSGSTLSSVPGKPNQREYVAGGNADPALPFFVDKIEIKKTTDGVTTAAYIHVLTTKDGFTISPMYLSEASDPANGTVQFELRGKNGPIPPERVIWKLLCGEGTFDDKTGVYTEPKDSPPGSFIIVSGTLPGDVVDLHGVTAVPLPLSKYAELIAAVNSTIAAD